MFGLFGKKTKRVTISDCNIQINNEEGNLNLPIEIEHVFKFTQVNPEIEIFENNNLVRTFRIDTLTGNPDLSGQFLHSSIRILANSAVMIDGIISRSATTFLNWNEDGYEAVRLQPFFLSNKNVENTKLKGAGLFQRGLHFGGTITPSGVRCICICDACNASFTIQHFHAGFSEVQYFYSDDSQETLIVEYNAVKNLPMQLQTNIDPAILQVVESKLPKRVYGYGEFRYYNPFRCPHCSTTFIDFEKNKELRASEYYGNTLINRMPIRYQNPFK